MSKAVILLGPLEQQTVLAEMVSMVRGIDLDGAVVQAGLSCRGADPANSVINQIIASDDRG